MTLILAFVMALGSGLPFVPQEVTCDPTLPGTTTFVVDPSQPVLWYDGGVAVKVARYTGRRLTFVTDRPVAGVILIGDHSERGFRFDRVQLRWRVRLPHDVIRSLLVCYS